jgi:hypothetical protein
VGGGGEIPTYSINSLAKQVRPSIPKVVQNKGKEQRKKRRNTTLEQRGRNTTLDLSLDVGFPNLKIRAPFLVAMLP